jgi:hypothetical protein
MSIENSAAGNKASRLFEFRLAILSTILALTGVGRMRTNENED